MEITKRCPALFFLSFFQVFGSTKRCPALFFVLAFWPSGQRNAALLWFLWFSKSPGPRNAALLWFCWSPGPRNAALLWCFLFLFWFFVETIGFHCRAQLFSLFQLKKPFSLPGTAITVFNGFPTLGVIFTNNELRSCKGKNTKRFYIYC